MIHIFVLFFRIIIFSFFSFWTFFKHYHILSHYFGSEFFHTFGCIPAACFQITFDVHKFSFFKVFVADFCQTRPGNNIVVLGQTVFFAFFGYPFTVCSDTESGYHLSVRCLAHLRIPCQVSNQDDFVYTSHHSFG